jgi:hypothetical protein
VVLILIAASAALRAAVHVALAADPALIAALGGPKIYDAPSRKAAFHYVTLGITGTRRKLTGKCATCARPR